MQTRFAHTYKKGFGYKYWRQIAMVKSCGKLSQQMATANSRGKFPRQILEYVNQKMVGSILCVGELHSWRQKENKEQSKSFFKLKKPLRQKWLKLED